MNISGLYYSKQIESIGYELSRYKKRSLIIYLIRLLSFAAFVAFIVFCVQKISVLWILLALFSAAIFVFSVRADKILGNRIHILENKLDICNSEILYLKHKFNFAATGSEYSVANPELSADFDLLGEGSVFQYVNRSATKIGSQRFAESILKFYRDKSEIVERQVAIAELSDDIDFLINYRASGLLSSEKGGEIQSLNNWLNQPQASSAKIRLLCIFIPTFFCAWILLIMLGIFSASSLILLIFINYTIVSLGGKLISQAHNSLDRIAEVFSKYAELIQCIEYKQFKSNYLLQIQKQIQGSTQGASSALRSLFGLLHKFDLRYNMLASFLLNSTFGFDFQIYQRLLTWKNRYGNSAKKWIDALSLFDSLIGFATYTFNNRGELVFPEVSNSNFQLNAEELGHPLIMAGNRVNNSVAISGQPSVMIITGANMAGKSTFLRTVAVSLIFAMNGAPVCARKFVFAPCDVVSSIKITDSLANNESYFYSELLRLKQILSYIEANPCTLVILDEILRGTNTKDKQIGTLGLLQNLITQKAAVIMATHDLSIGELANEYPQIVTNKCFEVELTDNKLVFDYKLKDGISKKLNASFLMKQMGIIES